MSATTENPPKTTATYAKFRIFSAAFYSLGILSVIALIVSGVASYALKAYSPLTYVPLWLALLPLFIIMGIWFYCVFRRLPRIPSRNWYWPFLSVALCVAISFHALHSSHYATPLVSAAQWPTTLALTGIVGIILTCLLAIPWSIIDAHIQGEQKAHKSATSGDTKTPTKAQFRQTQPWHRPALGATASALALIASYAIISPATAPVISYTAINAIATDSSIPQSAQGPQSLRGTIAWSMIKPASQDPIRLFPGATNPVLVQPGKHGYAQGLSEKDGSPLWEWKLSPISDSEIGEYSTTTSPDGRYLALAVIHSHPDEADDLYRIVIIDTTTGKELWNTIREDLDSSSTNHLILTNRVAAINRHVFDLSTGKELWQLPDDTIPIADIRASETLLTVPEEEYRKIAGPYQESTQKENSCYGCAIGTFTPVDDRTGKPKGKPMTNILTNSREDFAASRGWILLHNKETGSNTFRNIDTGKEIPAANGKPSTRFTGASLGMESLLLTFTSPDASQSEKIQPQDHYFFSHTFSEPIPIRTPVHERTFIPQGDTVLSAGIFLKDQALPTVRIAGINDEQPLLDIILPSLRNHDWRQLEGIRQIIPTREGILIHIGGSKFGDENILPPNQFIMLK
ncbi:MAG: hypothetical protein Q4C87_12270 [Actinomycetaceae bacterium]|nr:hypothetical protein [Actinomycetaceae bacterium]